MICSTAQMIEFLIVSHFSFFLRGLMALLCLVQFILCNIGSKRQIQTLEQIIKLSERFLTEVTEFKQVGLVVLYKITKGLDIGCFQTVKRTNRKVHIYQLSLEQLTHVQYFLVKLLVAFNIIILQCNLLVREKHEVINQYLGGFFQSIFRVNGTIRCYFKHKLVVVCLLFNTIRFNKILN